MFDYLIDTDLSAAAPIKFNSADIKTTNGVMLCVRAKITVKVNQNTEITLIEKLPSDVKYCSNIQVFTAAGATSAITLPENVVTIDNTNHLIKLKTADKAGNALEVGTILSFIVVLEVAK